MSEGYSAEGKLIYVNEAPEKTLILTESQTLISVDGRFSGTTGETVRIYHAYPISEQTVPRGQLQEYRFPRIPN